MREVSKILVVMVTLALFAVLSQILSVDVRGSATDATGASFTPASPGVIGTGAGLGVLLLGGWLLGKAAQLIGLSKITGYLAFGIVASPKVGALIVGSGGSWVLSAGQLENLVLVNDLAVALIALMAGGEIRFGELRSNLRAIGWVLALGSGATLLAVTGVVWVLMSAEGSAIAPPGGASAAWAMAAVVGVIATANSPAVVIALIGETGASGPLAKTSLAVTVCKDLLLVVMFATAMALAVSAVGAEAAAGAGTDGAAGGGGRGVTERLVRQLGGSLVGGVGVGLALAFYARRVRAHLPIVLVLGSFFVALLSEALGLKVLIVGLSAGLTVTNFFPALSKGLFERVEDVIVPVYAVFFGVAGTKVDPAALGEVWVLVLALVGTRAAAVWAGTTAGCVVGGVRGGAGRWMWTAFVSQAGVSLALVIVVTEEFAGQGFAGPLGAALISAIALNELLGPVLLKLGFVRAGEAGGGGSGRGARKGVVGGASAVGEGDSDGGGGDRL